MRGCCLWPVLQQEIFITSSVSEAFESLPYLPRCFNQIKELGGTKRIFE